MTKHTEPVPVPPDWKNLKHHPLSAIADFGAGIDMDRLAAHMRDVGYNEKEPIILFENLILDGRHRHQGAIMAEVVPTFERFIGTDPKNCIITKILRQHLTPSQLAMFGATLANLSEGRPAKTVEYSTVSQTEAAKIVGVSRELVVSATKVQSQGTPKLQAAVSAGMVSVSDAAKIVAEPAKVQNRAVKDVKAGKAPTATAAVEIGNDPELCFQCNRNRRTGQPAKRNCPECPKNQKSTPATKPQQATLDDPPKECGQCDCCAAWKEKVAKSGKFVKPTLEQVAAYCKQRKNGIDPEAFMAHYRANGWIFGKAGKPMKDWEAAIITWEKNAQRFGGSKNGKLPDGFFDGLKDFVARGEE